MFDDVSFNEPHDIIRTACLSARTGAKHQAGFLLFRFLSDQVPEIEKILKIISFLYIQQVSSASPPRAYLYRPSSADDHKDHFSAAFRTLRTAYQVFMAVGAKEIGLCVYRDLKLRFKIETAIEGRKP